MKHPLLYSEIVNTHSGLKSVLVHRNNRRIGVIFLSDEAEYDKANPKAAQFPMAYSVDSHNDYNPDCDLDSYDMQSILAQMEKLSLEYHKCFAQCIAGGLDTPDFLCFL